MDRCLLVTVIADDRVGVIRDVSGALFKCGGNLVDLRQMVIGGVFTLHCVTEFENGADPAEIRATVRAALGDPRAEVAVRPLPKAVVSAAGGERYVAAASGPDRPGRVNRITTVLARHHVNVEDWRHDLSDPAGRALTIGVVTVPAGCDVAAVARDLREALAPEGVATSLRHENIFRATNEVGPIDELLNRREAPHA